MVDKSLSPEISRLSSLLDTNPNSRLFVPLAEAYLQSDMRDEAIIVLSEGIKIHQKFVAARVMLGKIYLEKEAFPEAKAQFEQVIEIAPSNIPSLKGLAAIYREEGDVTQSRKTYQTIIKIDPTDKVAAVLMEALDVEMPSSAPSEMTEQPADITKKPEAETVLEPPDAPIFDAPAPDENRSETILEQAEATPGQAWNPEESEAGSFLQEEEASVSEEAADDDESTDDEVADQSGEEPLATHTLASLYMKQGCYQEAAEIYEKRLKDHPADQESVQGLQTALARLQGDSTPFQTPIQEGRSSKQKKIERLQLWLEKIQGEMKK